MADVITKLTAVGGLLLALLLGAGMLRSDASAQSAASCNSGGYAYYGLRPVARFDATPLRPQVGEPVVFDGSLSSRDDGGPVTRWTWDLDGDGYHEISDTKPQISRSYDKPGPVTVRLFVFDACGRVSGTTSRVLQVVPRSKVVPDSTPPVVTVSGPKKLRLSRALRKPVRLIVGCDELCAVSVKATVDARTRRALHRRIARIGAGSSLLQVGKQPVAVDLALPLKARLRAEPIRRGTLKFKVTARDAAGNRAVSTHRSKLR